MKFIFPSDDNDDDECNVENVVDKHLPNPRSPSVQAYSLVGRWPPCWSPCQPPCKLSHPPPSTSSQPSSQQHCNSARKGYENEKQGSSEHRLRRLDVLFDCIVEEQRASGGAIEEEEWRAVWREERVKMGERPEE